MVTWESITAIATVGLLIVAIVTFCEGKNRK